MSEYKGVYKATVYGSKSNRKYNEEFPYYARLGIKGVKWRGPQRATEKEAAIDYDKRLISIGMEPVNVLKRK